MSIGSAVAIDSLDHKYRAEDGRIYLSGIQAILRVMLDQCRADRRRGLDTAGLVSGYPGSPVGGVDFELARHRAVFAAHNIVHLPGLTGEAVATGFFRRDQGRPELIKGKTGPEVITFRIGTIDPAADQVALFANRIAER